MRRMPDPNFAHLIASLVLALFTGAWQPAPADLTELAVVQPVQFSAVWAPQDGTPTQQDLYVVGADGTVFAGATSSAVSSPKH
jgi:hypothetical protein